MLNPEMGSVFFSGFLLSAGLIMAIGAQNAYVLRQGLRREHVGVAVLAAAVCDAILIMIGVGGFGAIIAANPDWMAVARYGGAAFLLWFGARAMRHAIRGQAMHIDRHGSGLTRRQVLLAALAFSILNPHAWLDTVVLIGSVGSQQAEDVRLIFGAGAVTASFVWFAALGYGARVLVPLFEQPVAWRVLDAVVALILWSIAVVLLRG